MKSNKKYATVITFGTFDIFHIGHLKMLHSAASYGNKLVVGVSTDELNFSKKQRNPVYPTSERMEIIAAIKCVDQVFPEQSLELKEEYILKYKADAFIIGDDWAGSFDYLNSVCDVIYLPRTYGISTTKLISKIKTYE